MWKFALGVAIGQTAEMFRYPAVSKIADAVSMVEPPVRRGLESFPITQYEFVSYLFFFSVFLWYAGRGIYRLINEMIHHPRSE